MTNAKKPYTSALAHLAAGKAVMKAEGRPQLIARVTTGFHADLVTEIMAIAYTVAGCSANPVPHHSEFIGTCMDVDIWLADSSQVKPLVFVDSAPPKDVTK